MSLDFAQTLTASQNAIGAVNGAVNTASALASSLATPLSSGQYGTAARLALSGLPAAGEAVGDLASAVASFGGDANANDWRVRLSLANWSSFRSSPVLSPLKDAGGLIFPYTPTISIASAATYTSINTIHTNYTFRAFQNSDPGNITIKASMPVEDPTQGLYWIACVHYLRSLTKMFAGNDPKAGNPPPIIFLNGYGNYVFKNVPVIVSNFNVELPNDCDYIGVNVVGSAAGAAQGISDSINGLAGAVGDTLGGAIPGLSGVTDTISSIAGGVSQVAALAGTFGIGGTTSGGVSHVPTKSNFSVVLTPVYSRTSARNFSLDRFVTGGYLNNSFGYI